MKIGKHQRLIYIAIGAVVLFMFIMKSPPFSNSRVVRKILDVHPSELLMVKLEPLRYVRVDYNLVNGMVSFTDRAMLTQLCRTLNAAKKFSPDHPKSQWNCLITLVRNDGQYTFMVKKTYRNGTTLQIWSRKEWGWRLGRYRSDQLGLLLETFVSKKSD